MLHHAAEKGVAHEPTLARARPLAREPRTPARDSDHVLRAQDAAQAGLGGLGPPLVPRHCGRILSRGSIRVTNADPIAGDSRRMPAGFTFVQGANDDSIVRHQSHCVTA
jgi:hypothetical protein